MSNKQPIQEEISQKVFEIQNITSRQSQQSAKNEETNGENKFKKDNDNNSKNNHAKKILKRRKKQQEPSLYENFLTLKTQNSITREERKLQQQIKYIEQFEDNKHSSKVKKKKFKDNQDFKSSEQSQNSAQSSNLEYERLSEFPKLTNHASVNCGHLEESIINNNNNQIFQQNKYQSKMNKADVENDEPEVIINKDFDLNNNSNLYYYIYQYETQEYNKLKKEKEQFNKSNGEIKQVQTHSNNENLKQIQEQMRFVNNEIEKMLSKDLDKINVSSNPYILLQQFMKQNLSQDNVNSLIKQFQQKNKITDG